MLNLENPSFGRVFCLSAPIAFFRFFSLFLAAVFDDLFLQNNQYSLDRIVCCGRISSCQSRLPNLFDRLQGVDVVAFFVFRRVAQWESATLTR